MSKETFERLVMAWVEANCGMRLRVSGLIALMLKSNLSTAGLKQGQSPRAIETSMGMFMRRMVGRTAHGYRLCVANVGTHREYYLDPV